MPKIIDLRKIKKEIKDDGEVITETTEEVEVLEVEDMGGVKKVGGLEDRKLSKEINDSNISNISNVSNDVAEVLEEKKVGAEEVVAGTGEFLSFVVELAKVVVISLAIVVPVRYFLIQPFYVKGASMEPSFYDHEYLIINEIGYRLGEPERGDIVVFKYPRQPDQYFIKRIIGLPGERVVIKNSEVIIYNQENREGKILDESDYLLKNEKTVGDVDITLKIDEYFVLGDNRSSSLDSRSFGAVPRENIIGRTWLRGWPLDRLKRFEAPEYNL